MRRDPTVVEYLNTVLIHERAAINQYLLHARTLRHRGVTPLAKKGSAESIAEMHHAHSLIERIFLLDSLPTVQRLNPVMVGQTVQEVLEADRKLEEKALGDPRDGIAHAESVRDDVSRDLMRRILDNEEEHVHVLDRQCDLIGVERHIQLNSALATDQDSDATG